MHKFVDYIVKRCGMHGFLKWNITMKNLVKNLISITFSLTLYFLYEILLTSRKKKKHNVFKIVWVFSHRPFSNDDALCSYFDMKHSRWTKHMWNDVFVVWQRLFIFWHLRWSQMVDVKHLNKNQSLLTSMLDLLLIMIFTHFD